jgi:hypothetical protein
MLSTTLCARRAKLGIKQATVSKIERRADLYVSTLARFIEAMGGELEIRAVFPEGPVRLKRFGEAANSSANFSSVRQKGHGIMDAMRERPIMTRMLRGPTNTADICNLAASKRI